jgi:NAD(P) transhydrogenase subunit beta
MAAGKLQEVLPQRPITWRGQNFVNLSILAAALALVGVLVADPSQTALFPVVIVLSLAFGVLLIIPIGGADMPTVISLLNSYAGLSGAAMGFAIDNKILIVAGALDGASGLLLSIIMSRAMNRSFRNVLFGAFGKVQAQAAEGVDGAVQTAEPDEAAELLKMARLVIIVPGYGMAVAQAQYMVRQLSDALGEKGVEVKFAIHPVAGRMPGHMNVLLAEANVGYDQLFDMDQINPEFPRADVAIVVGANDVVNPAAKNTPGSPIYGMPVLNVDQAQTVMVIKRSMAPGFAGIDNELFVNPKTMMIFGDAKAVVGALVEELTRSRASL